MGGEGNEEDINDKSIILIEFEFSWLCETFNKVIRLLIYIVFILFIYIETFKRLIKFRIINLFDINILNFKSILSSLIFLKNIIINNLIYLSKSEV